MRAGPALRYGRNPPRAAYPFPDDPYVPDVDLDLDARWSRRVDSDVLDAYVGVLGRSSARQ